MLSPAVPSSSCAVAVVAPASVVVAVAAVEPRQPLLLAAAVQLGTLEMPVGQLEVEERAMQLKTTQTLVWWVGR